MLIQWCIQCKSVPFWMSEGFREPRSVPKPRLAVAAPVGWCQGLAGVIGALSLMAPDNRCGKWLRRFASCQREKEHLSTMARFSPSLGYREWPGGKGAWDGWGGEKPAEDVKRGKTCEDAWCLLQQCCESRGAAKQEMQRAWRRCMSRLTGADMQKKKAAWKQS